MQTQNNPAPRTPTFPLMPPNFRAPDTVDYARALVGANFVTLSGFHVDAAQVVPPWTHPAAVFIPAPVDVMDLAPTFRESYRYAKWLIALAALVLMFACFTAGAWLMSARSGDVQKAVSAGLTWSVTAVQANGVVLHSGDTSVLIKPGEKLPNGDLVISLMPDRSAVVLSSGVLVVHKGGARERQ